MTVTTEHSARSSIRTAFHRFGVVLLPLAGLWGFVPGLSPVLQMCCISLTLFGLIKLHVLVAYCGSNPCPSAVDCVAWFFCWPGLNAEAFFASPVVVRSAAAGWFAASAKIALGLLLLPLATVLVETNRLLAGWTFLTGLALVLHFGSFHVLALIWRSRGRRVEPIMNAPILSTSVSEFWSKRWNLAFRDYAHPFVFKPLARLWSPTRGVATGYVFSGIIHELAISLPAQGGYGLPTLYFTIQGLGILIERKARKAGWRISSGIRGWCWTALITAPPALILFHPPFIESVVMPLIEMVATIIGTGHAIT